MKILYNFYNCLKYKPFWIGTVIVICLYLLFLGDDCKALNTNNSTKSITNEEIERLRQKISKSATLNFSSSLEIKENVDFLLTPALLFQEAISDDAVITYPSE